MRDTDPIWGQRGTDRHSHNLLSQIPAERLLKSYPESQPLGRVWQWTRTAASHLGRGITEVGDWVGPARTSSCHHNPQELQWPQKSQDWKPPKPSVRLRCSLSTPGSLARARRQHRSGGVLRSAQRRSQLPFTLRAELGDPSHSSTVRTASTEPGIFKAL